jgi:HD superfamily phosphohydrolase
MKEIVSSQLDVDRMDYMVRDQANTGAQIGGFDIARVLRALRVGADGHFFVKTWGLPAIEAYLVTRYHMYHQVYFHKVNMLTQNYLVRMLARARKLANEGELTLTPSLNKMLLDEHLDAQGYASLNDAHVRVSIPEWAEHSDPMLSQYATKMMSRRDFHKSLRIEALSTEMVDVVKDRIEAAVADAGYDAASEVIYARISKRGYMPYEQGIMIEDGGDASEHSPLIRSLAQPHERALIFVPDALRDSLEQRVREWIKPTQSSLVQFE